jgi:hypothetical protein
LWTSPFSLQGRREQKERAPFLLIAHPTKKACQDAAQGRGEAEEGGGQGQVGVQAKGEE